MKRGLGWWALFYKVMHLRLGFVPSKLSLVEDIDLFAHEQYREVVSHCSDAILLVR